MAIQPTYPVFQQQLAAAIAGPSIGIGHQDVSSLPYSTDMVYAVRPGIQPAITMRAPDARGTISPAEQMGQIGPYQRGHPDLYSWRVASPHIPRSNNGYNEVAYQIFQNGSVYSGIISTPTIPIGGKQCP